MRLVFWPAASTLLIIGAWHAPTSQPDACAVLTVAQVGAALGTTVTADSGLAQQACSWGPPGDLLGKRVTLGIGSSAIFATDKSALPGPKVKMTPVPGLGDEAVVYVSSSGDPPMLDVRKGNTAIQITVKGFSPDQAQQKEESLAKLVLAKL